MDFEYDQAKSIANKRKHGIDFEDAQALWDDGDAIEITASTTIEPRFVVTGTIDDRHWTAVVTYRNDNIRLISVRHSRGKEIEVYEKNKSLHV
jgi:uncharacterized DUF497 family protein